MENGNVILDNVAYSPASHAGAQLRDNSQRAKVALIMVSIVLGLVVLMLVSDLMQYFMLQGAEQGLMSYEEAERNDLRQQLIGVIYIIVYIVSVVFFLRWFRRAYFNLGLAGVGKLFTDGWAVGAWFVPFMNLGRPFRIMSEIWMENTLLLERVSPLRCHELTRGKMIVGIWWTVHIINAVIGQVEVRLSQGADTIEKIYKWTTASIISDCLILLTGLLLLFIIRRVSAMEKEIYINQHLLGPQPITASI